MAERQFKVSFKEIIYDDISELEKAIKAKNELIKILIDLKMNILMNVNLRD